MIISMVNLKGGVGKTTTAIALATAAAQDGKSVTVLDADPQASASSWYDLAIENDEPLPFDVVPANVASVRRLSRLDENEWVFIDCPPSGSVTDEAVKVSDFVVIPTGTGSADLQKTIETAKTLEESVKFHAILVTRAVANTLSLKAAIGSFDDFDLSYFDAVVPQREDVRNFFGVAFGKDLYGYEAVYSEMKELLEVE